MVPDEDFSSGSRDAYHFAYCPVNDVGRDEMMQQGDGEYHVEAIVRKWKMVGPREARFAATVLSQYLQHSLGRVYAGYMPVGFKSLHEGSRSATDVESLSAVEERCDDGDAFAQVVGDYVRRMDGVVVACDAVEVVGLVVHCAGYEGEIRETRAGPRGYYVGRGRGIQGRRLARKEKKTAATARDAAVAVR